MEDRHKFRTWIPEVNCYATEVQPYLYCHGKIYHDQDSLAGSIDITERCILEFCTGLKDKNGKLIYEGDLIEGTPAPYVVVWWPCYACFAKRRHGVTTHLSQGTNAGELEEHAKVIGNVRENPELYGANV